MVMQVEKEIVDEHARKHPFKPAADKYKLAKMILKFHHQVTETHTNGITSGATHKLILMSLRCLSQTKSNQIESTFCIQSS